MPIYFAWFTTALLSVGGDTSNQNLPQSGRLLYCVGRGFLDIYPARSHLRAQLLTVIDASRTLLWLPSGLDVGVGVFPQRKKIFVGGQRLWHETRSRCAKRSGLCWRGRVSLGQAALRLGALGSGSGT